MPLKVGEKAKRYTVTKIINEGAMANSYFVKDGSVTYFMKEYTDPRETDPIFQPFLENQNLMCDTLNSMGSVTEKFIDHFVENGNYFQVKEKLEGINLEKWLFENGDFEKRKIISLLLCGILKNLHSYKIIHQDLKPAQFMLVNDEIGRKTKLGYRLILSDFDWSIPNGNIIKIVGTIMYKSPECYNLQTPNEKSDIFTLGIIIFELLTGINPYNHGNEALDDEIKARVLSKKILKSPKELNSDITDELNNILIQTLEVKPENRPSLEELQNALFDRKDRFSQFKLVSSGKTMIVYNSREFGRKEVKDFYSDLADGDGNPLFKYCDDGTPMLYFQKNSTNNYFVYAQEGTKNYFVLNGERITSKKIQINKGDKLTLFGTSKSKAVADFEIS